MCRRRDDDPRGEEELTSPCFVRAGPVAQPGLLAFGAYENSERAAPRNAPRGAETEDLVDPFHHVEAAYDAIVEHSAFYFPTFE